MEDGEWEFDGDAAQGWPPELDSAGAVRALMEIMTVSLSFNR